MLEGSGAEAEEAASGRVAEEEKLPPEEETLHVVPPDRVEAVSPADQAVPLADEAGGSIPGGGVRVNRRYSLIRRLQAAEDGGAAGTSTIGASADVASI